MARIAILDYGMGNLRSVEKALERVGADPLRTADAEAAGEADGLVLPGVGAFPEAMRRMSGQGFDSLIESSIGAGKPLLGICLGMQLLFRSSTELGGAQGLGLIDGEVTRLESPRLKVPHIGWEPVHWARADEPLIEGIAQDTPYYFVHSFAALDAGPAGLATTNFGELEFVSVVADGSVYGAQFHPEKSSGAGLRMLENFAGICDRAMLAA